MFLDRKKKIKTCWLRMSEKGNYFGEFTLFFFSFLFFSFLLFFFFRFPERNRSIVQCMYVSIYTYMYEGKLQEERQRRQRGKGGEGEV